MIWQFFFVRCSIDSEVHVDAVGSGFFNRRFAIVLFVLFILFDSIFLLEFNE